MRPNGWELIIVLLLVLVVFGAKRLPDSARSLGRSMRILKAETKGLRSDDEQASSLSGASEQRFDPYTGKLLKPPANGDPTA